MTVAELFLSFLRRATKAVVSLGRIFPTQINRPTATAGMWILPVSGLVATVTTASEVTPPWAYWKVAVVVSIAVLTAYLLSLAIAETARCTVSAPPWLRPIAAMCAAVSILLLLAPAVLQGATAEHGGTAHVEEALSAHAAPCFAEALTPLPSNPTCPATNVKDYGLFSVRGSRFIRICFHLDVTIFQINIQCTLCECHYMGTHPRTYSNLTWVYNISNCDFDFPIGIEV